VGIIVNFVDPVCCYYQSHVLQQVRAHWLWLSIPVQLDNLLLHLVDDGLVSSFLLHDLRRCQANSASGCDRPPAQIDHSDVNKWSPHGRPKWQRWSSLLAE